MLFQMNKQPGSFITFGLLCFIDITFNFTL